MEVFSYVDLIIIRKTYDFYHVNTLINLSASIAGGLSFSLLDHFSSFFFFLRKKLMDFINKIQLHLIVKSNQYEMGHLPSIFENLVCIMHF